jgi:hypothetical protein
MLWEPEPSHRMEMKMNLFTLLYLVWLSPIDCFYSVLLCSFVISYTFHSWQWDSLHQPPSLIVSVPLFHIFILEAPCLGSTFLPMTSCQMNIGKGPTVALSSTLWPEASTALSSQGGERSPVQCPPSLRYSACHSVLSVCAQDFQDYF